MVNLEGCFVNLPLSWSTLTIALTGLRIPMDTASGHIRVVLLGLETQTETGMSEQAEQQAFTSLLPGYGYGAPGLLHVLGTVTSAMMVVPWEY